MISEIFLVLGAGVLALALRSFGSPVLFRLGTLGFVATSFLAGWLLGGNTWIGMAFASTWFLLPWVEILTRVRKMRLPLHRSLAKCPPPPHSRFPGFGDLSDEMESAGFEYVEDVDWSHDSTRHFYRLFYNAQKRVTGTICLVEQDRFSFFYSSFTSRSKDGRNFLSWNYPFTQGMHLLPNTCLNRVDEDCDIEGLLEEHQSFLAEQPVNPDEIMDRSAESLREEAESEMKDILEHNISRGILKRDGEEMIRYSWRGMFYLWAQFLREFVRFS